jgi:LysR family transcriptional activator of nhaA
MRINYNHLRYFYFVAHEQHLTRAAQKLHLSQSALSAQIKTLERELGHELFERVGRSLELTEVGRIVLEHADAIFHSGEELLYRIAHHQEVPRRNIRIGSIPTLSRNFQIEFYRPLLDTSDIELSISSASLPELVRRLESHQLDIALTNTPVTGEAGTQLVSHLISEQPVSLIAPAEHGYDTEDIAGLLSREPLILPSPESNIRLAFDALIERLGIAVQIKAEISDMTMLRLIAREGNGVAVVPPIVVKDELESGILRELTALPGIAETFYAIVLKRRFPNPLIKYLLQDRRKNDGDVGE